MKKIFVPKTVKDFGGPVAPVVIAGGFAFVSGHIAMDPVTGEIIHGTIEEETRYAIGNLKMVVEEMGASLDDVVKIDLFMADMDEFDRMNVVYEEFFGNECPPARVGVATTLWGGMKIEIGATVKMPD